jgi:hypothetical protein
VRTKRGKATMLSSVLRLRSDRCLDPQPLDRHRKHAVAEPHGEFAVEGHRAAAESLATGLPQHLQAVEVRGAHGRRRHFFDAAHATCAVLEHDVHLAPSRIATSCFAD